MGSYKCNHALIHVMERFMVHSSAALLAHPRYAVAISTFLECRINPDWHIMLKAAQDLKACAPRLGQCQNNAFPYPETDVGLVA